MLVTENGNYFFDVELIFKHNRTRLKLERNSNIASKNDMLKLLSNRRRSAAFTNFGGSLSASGFHRAAFFLTLKVTPNTVDTSFGAGFHIFIDWNQDASFLRDLGGFKLENDGIIQLDGNSEIDWLDVDFIKRKLPLIFDYYLIGFSDKTAEDEAEVAVREENKFKKIPTSLGFENRLVSDI